MAKPVKRPTLDSGSDSDLMSGGINPCIGLCPQPGNLHFPFLTCWLRSGAPCLGWEESRKASQGGDRIWVEKRHMYEVAEEMICWAVAVAPARLLANSIWLGRGGDRRQESWRAEKMRFGDISLQMCSLDTVMGAPQLLDRCPQEGTEHHTAAERLLTTPQFETCFQEFGVWGSPVGEFAEFPWGTGQAWSLRLICGVAGRCWGHLGYRQWRE